MSPQKDQKKLFIEKIQRLSADVAPPIENAIFADVIYAASTHGISETHFRDAFGLSAGAVDRWIAGNNLPHADIRTAIFIWITDQLCD